MSDFEARFGGIQRLYGDDSLERLRKAHVCVVGIGGVGSWAAEALARSAVGAITLVDLDDICVSNINRQIQALDNVVGHSKVSVMAARIQSINPECRVNSVAEFFTAENAEHILRTRFNFVMDAIDPVANKCLLIARCCQKNIPVLCAGGAGGRKNPAAIQITDLSQTAHDALLQRVRKKLRDEFGFPRGAKERFGVPCVFSPEPPVEIENDDDRRGGCDSAYGTASFVTGAFGFLAASHIVSSIAAIKPDTGAK